MKFYFLNNLFVNKILFLNKIILNKILFIFFISKYNIYLVQRNWIKQKSSTEKQQQKNHP